jgi:threonylcarbamoyladenosine tRNA methylthiotransferase MtaB
MIAKQFEERGFSVKDFGKDTDLFVLNSCSVTHNADRETKQIIRRIHRENPSAFIVVTGCSAQLNPGEIADIEGVDLVLGENEKFNVFDYLDTFEKKDLSCRADVFITSIDEMKNFGDAFSSDIDSRTRAFMKIQDGCDYNCTFCTIPLARGKSRSQSPEKIIEIAKKIIDAGYKEIVLTGVNTGDYRFQIADYRLINLLYELDKLNISRYRISSIEPNLLTDEVIQFVKSSEKFCNHFHIPLQSGDNNILGLMKRRYKKELFSDLVFKLKKEINDVGIGVDVLVGFPSETEESFEATYNFLEKLPVSYLHVFTYSERKNTIAFDLPGSINPKIRRERSKKLRELSIIKKTKFYSENINTKQKVLFENLKENGYIEGYTTNYIKVKSTKHQAKENEIKEIMLTKADGAKPIEGKAI